MAQQYSLKWNNHQPNFISMFAMLRNSQALVDVTLAAEGRHLHAHKMVLSACSPYFHSLFVENPSQHPIVILKDVAFSDLRTIVDFMYYGEVNITQEELPQMLHSAKSLKVKGLTETESTAVMRSQSSDFPYEAAGEASGEPTGEPIGEQAREIPNEPSNEPSNESTGEEQQRRPSASPTNSPASKRRRRRRSSNVSASLNMVGEENRDDQNMEMREGITMSSVPRRRDFSHDDSNTQQNTEPQNISIDDLNVDHNSAGMPQGGQWSMMEHTYPRYTNSCFGGSLGGEGGGGMYMMHAHAHAHAQTGAHMEGELYGAPAGPSCAPAAAPLAEPPPAAPQKRRRTTNPQSEENFQRALEAVRIGGIGFCKAARMFGVNNRTLWLEYKKKGYPNNRPSIKSRIKREHATPPPAPHKEETTGNGNGNGTGNGNEPHMALLCHPAHPHAAHHLSVGFVESRPLDLPQGLQGINILGGLNFNSMQ